MLLTTWVSVPPRANSVQLLLVTYPTEFVKTRAQFAVAAGSKPPGPIDIVRSTVSQYGIRGLYSGCSALVAGNAVKAGVRFLSYDSIKLAVADKEVSVVIAKWSSSLEFLTKFLTEPCSFRADRQALSPKIDSSRLHRRPL